MFGEVSYDAFVKVFGVRQAIGFGVELVEACDKPLDLVTRWWKHGTMSFCCAKCRLVFSLIFSVLDKQLALVL